MCFWVTLSDCPRPVRLRLNTTVQQLSPYLQLPYLQLTTQTYNCLLCRTEGQCSLGFIHVPWRYESMEPWLYGLYMEIWLYLVSASVVLPSATWFTLFSPLSAEYECWTGKNTKGHNENPTDLKKMCWQKGRTFSVTSKLNYLRKKPQNLGTPTQVKQVLGMEHNCLSVNKFVIGRVLILSKLPLKVLLN